MAEAFICRGGYGGTIGGSDIPITPGYGTIRVTLLDSNGIAMPYMAINCRDGSIWYNYHTNENGQILFTTNSGTAHITAYNFSIKNNFKYIDQSIAYENGIDMPASSVKDITMQLSRINSVAYNRINSNIQNHSAFFDGNYWYRVTDYVNVKMRGGGGGFGASTNYNYGGGGGGGGYGDGGDDDGYDGQFGGGGGGHRFDYTSTDKGGKGGKGGNGICIIQYYA